MKNIAAQMVNFDREQMRRIANNMPEQYDEKPQVQQVAQIINGVFSQLLATFPASLANRDQNEVNEIRRQWVLAFRENGITTMEQVNAGMRVARRQNRPFLPSPGQFVAWCREEASVIAGLPNVSELVDMVYEYCRKRGLYPDAESYPWKSNAHYWLITNLYQNMRANALTDAELRRKAADELVHMTARINRGEAIPEPVKQLPVMGGRPLNRAQALATVHQSSTDVYYRIQSGIDGDRAGRQEGGMRRQRRSFTDIICENCKYLPTKRSRNKRKPIPKESDVKTFNYTAHLWDIRWLRYRARK